MNASYHEAVACKKLFLSLKVKEKRFACGKWFCDWSEEDWDDVILLDKYAISVGNMGRTAWVTRCCQKMYEED